MELEPFVIETLKEMADEAGTIKRFRLIKQDVAEMKFSLDLSSLDTLRFQDDPRHQRIGINNITITALVTIFDTVAQEATKLHMSEMGIK